MWHGLFLLGTVFSITSNSAEDIPGTLTYALNHASPTDSIEYVASSTQNVCFTSSGMIGDPRVKIVLDGGALQFANTLSIENAISIPNPSSYLHTDQYDITILSSIEGELCRKKGQGSLQIGSYSDASFHVEEGSLHLLNGSSDYLVVELDRSCQLNLSEKETPILALLTGSPDSTVLLGNKTLILVNDEGCVYDGVISGEGGLVKSGTSTLRLTAPHAYTGSTTLAEGTLSLAGIGSLHPESRLTLNEGTMFDLSEYGGSYAIAHTIESTPNATVHLGSKTLIFSSANSCHYHGKITGDGPIVKEGTGSLTLSGASTATGPLTVAKGEIVYNGSYHGPIFISPSGKLSGSGTLRAILNNGIFAPGNSIGTSNVTIYEQSPDGILEEEVNGLGDADLIVSSGNAILNGTIQILPEPGTYTAGTQSTIIQASQVIGTFSRLENTDSSKLYQVLYNPTTVEVRLLATNLSGNALSAATSFATLPVFPLSDTALVSEALLADPNFNQLSPSLSASIAYVQASTIRQLDSDLRSHLRKPCTSPQPHCLWLQISGRAEEQQEEYSSDSLGAQLGFDGKVGNSLLLGALLDYTYSLIDAKNSSSQSWLNNITGGLYGALYTPLFAELSILASYNQIRSKRSIEIDTLTRNARSSDNGYSFLCGLTLASPPFHKRILAITPYAHVDYILSYQPSYTESGAEALDLHIDSKAAQFIDTEIGLYFSTCYQHFEPQLKVAYANQTPLSNGNYKATFADGDTPFSTTEMNPTRNLFVGGLSFRVPFTHATFYLGYDLLVGSGYLSQEGLFEFSSCF